MMAGFKSEPVAAFHSESMAGFVGIRTVDHCNSECVGIHAAHSGNRFEALEPIRCTALG